MAANSTVKVTFLGDAKSLAAAAKAATGSLDQVSKTVGKASKAGAFLGTMAGGLALGALSKVQAFARGSVDAFAAVEDATGAAGVQFGDQLPAVLAYADAAAKSFGLSKRAALDAQNTFGTLGKAAGLTGTDLSGFSQKLTGLAGDLASFKGTSTEQAITAMGAALRGETEPIRAYGVMLDQAAIEAEALALGLAKPVKNMADISAAQARAMLAQKGYNAAVAEHGKDSDEATRANLTLGTATRALDKAVGGSVPKLTMSNKVLASQSLILKQTTDAQGDYARTANSTANTQKTLAAESENAQAVLGARLAPALTALRQLSITAMGAVSGLAAGIGAASTFVGDNATAFKVLAGVVGAIVVPALIAMGVQWTITGVKATISAAKQAAAWLMTQMSAYKTVAVIAGVFAMQIAGWLRMAVVSMASAIKVAAAWLISMGPIGLVIAAVIGLVVVIVKNWDKIKAATVAVWNAVVGFVKKAVSLMVSALMNFTGPGLVIKHWDKIVAIVKAVPGKLVGAVGDFLKMGGDLIGGFIQGIKDKAGDILATIKSYITDKIPGWMKKPLGIDSPSKLTRGYGQNLSEGLALGIKDKAKAVAEATEKMVEKVKAKLTEAKDFAKELREAFRDAGNVTGIDTSSDGGDTGFAGLLAGLKAKAADAAEFATAMAKLRSSGLNETSLAHLRESGPTGGLGAARNLLAGGAGGIGEVNSLTAQLAATGNAFAEREAKAKYGLDGNASFTKAEVRVLFDVTGADADMKKMIRKMVRIEGGSVQKTFGK